MSERPGRNASRTPDDDAPVLVISVAADLAGMHAQTLRQYDRLGLVIPRRARGGGRRYSYRDVTRLREIQTLSQQDGISLAGVRRILDLEAQVAELQQRVEDLGNANRSYREALQAVAPRLFAAGRTGEDVVQLAPGRRPRRPSPSRAITLWRPQR